MKRELNCKLQTQKTDFKLFLYNLEKGGQKKHFYLHKNKEKKKKSIKTYFE